ncbi:hypothetical protein B0H14DRAFT_3147251 [Mycena olivaceomarginata]|nr:hypothetical protein B0H14DRAFT_3147251 [Mycena olivaceomarginata]
MTLGLFSLFSRASLMLPWTCNHLRRQCLLFSRGVAIPRPGYTSSLRYSTRPESTDNTDVRHSEFLADAGSGSPWKESQGQSLNGAAADELDKLTTGKGALASMGDLPHQDTIIQQIMRVEFPGAVALAMTGSLVHQKGQWVIHPDHTCLTITTESIETFCTPKGWFKFSPPNWKLQTKGGPTFKNCTSDFLPVPCEHEVRWYPVETIGLVGMNSSGSQWTEQVSHATGFQWIPAGAEQNPLASQCPALAAAISQCRPMPISWLLAPHICKPAMHHFADARTA